MDTSRDASANIDVRTFSTALRQMSVALRARSRAARARSMSLRKHHVLPMTTPPVLPVGGDSGDGGVSLGTIKVSELFEILVDHHDFKVSGAVRALVVALEQAGYPGEAASVSAADGIDIIQGILNRA